MHLALLMIGLLLFGMVVAMVVVARHGLLGLVVVVLVNMVVLGLGMYHKKIEVRTRSLQAGSDALAKEYRRICETWVKKPLPDF